MSDIVEKSEKLGAEPLGAARVAALRLARAARKRRGPWKDGCYPKWNSAP